MIWNQERGLRRKDLKEHEEWRKLLSGNAGLILDIIEKFDTWLLLLWGAAGQLTHAQTGRTAVKWLMSNYSVFSKQGPVV